MTARRFLLLTAFAPAACFAQAFDPGPPAGVPAAEGTVNLAFALRWIDVSPGSGDPAAPGRKYRVHYTGWLRDGKKFDSSRDRNEPFEFVQGRRQVIAGWDAGFEGLRVGGKRRIFIPYQLAYGVKGRGSIPPLAELIFDVELLAVLEAPEVLAASDLLYPLAGLENKVLGLAHAVPAEKYSWRPGPGIRSFAEVMIHIANGNQLLINVATKAPSPEARQAQVQSNARRETEPLDKEKILALLQQSFTETRRTLETLSAGALSRDADFFGHPSTARGVLTILDTHLAEHLGQAIAYARMIGIVPPWPAVSR